MTMLILICACIPAVLFCWNVLLYRKPPQRPDEGLAAISVLIPARNEERSIAAAVASVLASEGIDFELIVLDDGSRDRTAELVKSFAEKDLRVRLESGKGLPAGWNGKQHACYVLASLARHETLCFLDADVRIEPQALVRMATFLRVSRASLVSGFPRQETETFLEKLLLPLIHFVLLGYLPLAGMRRYPTGAGFAAGCGQFLMMRRDAYWAVGGHRAIQTTMHDGLLLPKVFRENGFATDLADLTELATCRMYRSASEVWSGLSKNATEGIAAPVRIVPFTVLLGSGAVLPIVALRFAFGSAEWPFAVAAVFAAYLPRMIAAARFRQSWMSALLHPVGVAVMLALEWNALFRRMAGRKSAWKDRAYDAG